MAHTKKNVSGWLLSSNDNNTSTNCNDTEATDVLNNADPFDGNEQLFEKINYNLLIMILLLSIVNNSTWILSLIKKKKRMNLVDKLLVNSAVCNIMIVVSSIPTQLIGEQVFFKVFGPIACRLFYPVSTYAVICMVFTFVAVSIERLVVVSSIRYKAPSKRRCFILFAFLHLLGISCVFPYIQSLSLNTCTYYCDEKWKPGNSKQIYTLSLVAIQYVIPLCIMVTCYVKAWFIVYRSNWRVITTITTAAGVMMFPGYKPVRQSISLYDSSRKMSSSTTSPPQVSSSTKLRQKRHSQVVACERRQQQNRQLLKRFTVIMIVFATCMLPNQIHWILVDFVHHGDQYYGQIGASVSYLLTYANCVVNPLIYHPSVFYAGKRAVFRLISAKFGARTALFCH